MYSSMYGSYEVRRIFGQAKNSRFSKKSTEKTNKAFVHYFESLLALPPES